MDAVTVTIPLSPAGKQALRWLTRQPFRRTAESRDVGIQLSAFLTIIGRILSDPSIGEDSPLEELLDTGGFNDELDYPVAGALLPGTPIGRLYAVTEDRPVDGAQWLPGWVTGTYVVEVDSGIVWEFTEETGILRAVSFPSSAVDEYDVHLYDTRQIEAETAYIRVVRLFEMVAG